MWGGRTVPPNTMNVAGLYLQLLALFILTSIQCKVPCLNDFRDKQGVLKLMMGALRPTYCTTRRSYSANRKISTGSQASEHWGKQRRATMQR